MKQPLTILVVCLLVVLAATGYGWYERNQGAQQALARAHADSLLQASESKQRQIALQDSIRSRVSLDSLQRLNVEIRTTKHLVSQAQARGDSIAQAILGDSVVPRDSVQALVGAFQAERQASQQTVADLQAQVALLETTVAAKDSTIRALNTLLDGNRAQLRAALAPQSPGLLARVGRIAELALALRGGLAVVTGH